MVGAAYKRAENIPIALWLAGSALADSLIAVFMTISLRKMKNGIMETEILINRLICIVVETGSLAAVVSIVTLTLVLGLPESYLVACPMLFLSKLYSNSVLSP